MKNGCITVLWLSITILFTLTMILSMVSPVWFENVEHEEEAAINNNVISERENTVLIEKKNITDADDLVSFGLLRYCRRYDLDNIIESCPFYEDVQSMPSISSIVSVVIYGVGVMFFAVSVVLAMSLPCVSYETQDRVKTAAAYVQAIGVGFLGIAVIMFPIGLDSEFTRKVCGPNAGMFQVDQCQIAWGYMVGIMTVFLTMFCPILAKYSIPIKEYDESEEAFAEFEYKSESISLTTSSSSKVMTTV